MTSVNLDALLSPLGGLTSDRATLALSQAIFDSQVQPQAAPFDSLWDSFHEVPPYFKRLLAQDGCQNAWDNYTDSTRNTFIGELARGSLSLNGFRHYTIQDAIYLEYYVRVRIAAVGSLDSDMSSDEFQKFVEKQTTTLRYSQSTRSACTNQLGVPKADVDKEWDKKSSWLRTSIKHYEEVIVEAMSKDGGNSWLDIHFALLPCIRGYFTIADALLKSTTTVRNTLYYTMWILPNADSSSVKKYDGFLEKNSQNASNAQWAQWGRIFRQACENEFAFFNLALWDFPKYNIVTAADSYTIRPFAYSNQFLAFDEYGAIISTTLTKWTLENSEKGYDLKSGATYLNFDGQKLGVKASADETTKWSINAVPIMGPDTFQLFPAEAIQCTLEVDGNNKVSVTKNGLNTQIWILNSA